jgi:cobyrinic acid a,c-diamide synthase
VLAAAVWQAELVGQIRQETAAAVLGKRHLGLTPVREFLQVLQEPQLNMAAVEMVTTTVQQQQLHDLVPEVMA